MLGQPHKITKSKEGAVPVPGRCRALIKFEIVSGLVSEALSDACPRR